MPTYSCGERLQRGGLGAFFYSLPGIILGALGWIGFLVGFGWLNEQTILFEINGSHVGRGILAEYYLLAISPPIYFTILSIYMLTGLWAVGILSQIVATLVMLVAGGIAYTAGIRVALQFETSRVLLSTEAPTLAEHEIYVTVVFAGSVLVCIGMVYSMTLIPVVTTFQLKQIFDDPYAQPDDNRQRVHLKSTLCSLPATVLTTLGWITFVVGFGWLNQQHSYLLPQGSTHTGRWALAGFYILAVCPPIYFIVYFVYMLTGQWAVGILSQFGATVVTVATGGMAYSIGMSITQLADNGLSTISTQQRHEIFWIVAFSGAIVVSIGMAFSNALVPVLSSLCHNKPLEIRTQSGRSPWAHEMTRRSPYGYR